MILFDSHLDLAWNALEWNRDLSLPVAEIRRREREQGLTSKGCGANTVSYPELRRGKVAVFLATLLARLVRPDLSPPLQRYATMEAAYGAARGQLAYYRALEAQGLFRFLGDVPTLEARRLRLAEPGGWPGTAGVHREHGRCRPHSDAGPGRRMVAGRSARHWSSPLWDQSLRPRHQHTRRPVSSGTTAAPGDGCVGMILDITHLSDQAFTEAMDIYGGPVLASHHNCRSLVPDQRQISDEQIRQLVARGGVIGVAFDAWMLHPGWVRDQTTPQEAGVTLETVVRHIDHICQLTGNALHVGIGSDLDGGFGREQAPADLDTIVDLQRLPDLLRKRGYDTAAIEGIMYSNWLRFFKEAWSDR